jgi:multisubunit Na+/H+ antiporter MnhB subunit
MLTTIHLIAHIIAGTVTLIAGPIAIFYNFKNTRNHRIAGKVFFYAMLYVCFSAVMGYLRRPDLIFYEFLLGIAVIVLAGVIRGIRSIRMMKGASVQTYDWAMTGGLGLFGLWMLYRAFNVPADTNVAIPILFGVFGSAALFDTFRFFRTYRLGEQVEKLDWYRFHVQDMLGAFTASTTAFTVNAAHFLPWYIQWFGPTLLIVPFQIYFGRKIKSWKQQPAKISAD